MVGWYLADGWYDAGRYSVRRGALLAIEAKVLPFAIAKDESPSKTLMIFMVPFYALHVCVKTIMDIYKLNKTEDLMVAPVFTREFKNSNDATI